MSHRDAPQDRSGEAQGEAGKSAAERDATRHRAATMTSEPPSVIYEAIRQTGAQELARGALGLWWSAVAAGVAISLSVICKGFFVAVLPQADWVPAVSNLGYAVGFLVVILGRMQLFTENTITPILQLFLDPSRAGLWCTARLWAIVFAANLTGCAVAAVLLVVVGIVPDPQMAGIMEVARKYAELTPVEHLIHGMPAGFLIASLVWILPRLTGAGEVMAILIVTYMIGLGHLSHVVAGATDLFVLVLAGEVGPGPAAAAIAASLVGNIVGGTGMFAALTYAQVRQEL